MEASSLTSRGPVLQLRGGPHTFDKRAEAPDEKRGPRVGMMTPWRVVEWSNAAGARMYVELLQARITHSNSSGSATAAYSQREERVELRGRGRTNSCGQETEQGELQGRNELGVEEGGMLQMSVAHHPLYTASSHSLDLDIAPITRPSCTDRPTTTPTQNGSNINKQENNDTENRTPPLTSTLNNTTPPTFTPLSITVTLIQPQEKKKIKKNNPRTCPTRRTRGSPTPPLSQDLRFRFRFRFCFDRTSVTPSRAIIASRLISLGPYESRGANLAAVWRDCRETFTDLSGWWWVWFGVVWCGVVWYIALADKTKHVKHNLEKTEGS
ncbi:hypothetical protein IWX47DRAFT_841513 [Phyllosticta citricarpa]